jgi:hypothetical protein
LSGVDYTCVVTVWPAAILGLQSSFTVSASKLTCLAFGLQVRSSAGSASDLV